MQQTRSRKSSAKSMRQRPAAQRKNQSEITDLVIRGLETLAAVAEGEQMGPAQRILFLAKEELVHWAVTMNFHESGQDRFINRHLYGIRRPATDAQSLHLLTNPHPQRDANGSVTPLRAPIRK